MKHFVCFGCGTSTEEMAVCETEACAQQWEMHVDCDCADGRHGKAESSEVVKDANGNPLQDGDSVTLIKDLTLRGTSRVIKRGTKVTGIRLTENLEEVDCKINGTGIVLRTEFLKRL